MSRRIGLVLLSASLGAAPSAQAFGPIVHEAVTTRAIETLPKPIREYYKNHRLELPSLALDTEGEPPREGPERRFALDALGSFPFLELPRSEAALRERHGEALDRAGRLPFLLRESFERLVEAFKAGEKTRILEESDVLAGLVTDLYNPLALTKNFDGQETGQHGLWVRFSDRLPLAMERRLKLSPDAAHYLDDPKEHVFSIMLASYVWVDNLLYLDWLAKRGKSGYSEIYYEALELRAGEQLKELLSGAAGSVGSFWYTAWTEAGRPELR
jgi:hypothetical protein